MPVSARSGAARSLLGSRAWAAASSLGLSLPAAKPGPFVCLPLGVGVRKQVLSCFEKCGPNENKKRPIIVIKLMTPVFKGMVVIF